jgi:3-deoxy-D-manno-octulosonic-acid transferase
LQQLAAKTDCNILLTTNTRQGVQILQAAIESLDALEATRRIRVAYFPFDQPRLMRRAVGLVRPRLMVLVESEMWPGHLAALKKESCPVVIINGRMRPETLKKYRLLPGLWRSLKPDKILAVSDEDAGRFADLFDDPQVAVMPNIKFDRIQNHFAHRQSDFALGRILPPDRFFIVLGSVRQAEETQVGQIIREILRHHPSAIIGLFPRHLHRVRHWLAALKKWQIPSVLRSQIKNTCGAAKIILWDTFGELNQAYELADAAFIGGSLKPLGGQNFLEPLSHGIVPVMGPHWENFRWVGQQIVEQKLLRVGRDWQAVTRLLLSDLTNKRSRAEVTAAVIGYVRQRQGGTLQACRVITDFLKP